MTENILENRTMQFSCDPSKVMKKEKPAVKKKGFLTRNHKIMLAKTLHGIFSGVVIGLAAYVVLYFNSVQVPWLECAFIGGVFVGFFSFIKGFTELD